MKLLIRLQSQRLPLPVIWGRGRAGSCSFWKRWTFSRGSVEQSCRTGGDAADQGAGLTCALAVLLQKHVPIQSESSLLSPAAIAILEDLISQCPKENWTIEHLLLIKIESFFPVQKIGNCTYFSFSNLIFWIAARFFGFCRGRILM